MTEIVEKTEKLKIKFQHSRNFEKSQIRINLFLINMSPVRQLPNVPLIITGTRLDDDDDGDDDDDDDDATVAHKTHLFSRQSMPQFKIS